METVINALDQLPLLDQIGPIVGIAAITYVLAAIPSLILEALNDQTDYQ